MDNLRVMSFAPTASTNIKPHVKTMVALSLINPYCQKMIWSGLRRMTVLRRWSVVVSERRAGKPRRDEPRYGKSEHTCQQPLPMTVRDNIEPADDDSCP